MYFIDPSEYDGIWLIEVVKDINSYTIKSNEKTDWSINKLNKDDGELKYLQKLYPKIYSLSEVSKLIAFDLVNRLKMKSKEDIILIAPIVWPIAVSRKLALNLSLVNGGRVSLIWEPLFTLIEWIETNTKTTVESGLLTTSCIRGKDYSLMIRIESDMKVFEIRSVIDKNSNNASLRDLKSSVKMIVRWLYGDVQRTDLVKVTCPLNFVVRINQGWRRLDNQKGAFGLVSDKLKTRSMISLQTGAICKYGKTNDLVFPLGDIESSIDEMNNLKRPLVLHWKIVTRNRISIGLCPMEEYSSGKEFLLPNLVETFWAELPTTHVTI